MQVKQKSTDLEKSKKCLAYFEQKTNSSEYPLTHWHL